MNDLSKELKQRSFRTKKALGQNFIFDKNLLAKIAATASGGLCLEIGPGPGGLTEQLIKVCEKVVAVEIDQELYTFLDETFTEDNFEVIHGDFMELDIEELYKEHFNAPFEVVANLPYYITTPILMRILDSDLPVTSITVLVQKEVAQRIVAKPGKKDYGVLSVMVQCRGEAKMLFDIPPGAFSPPPSVTSTLIQIKLTESPLITSLLNDFRRCVRACFSARRKQIANNLSRSYHMDKAEVGRRLESVGIAANKRAEQLSIEDFDRLCQAFVEH